MKAPALMAGLVLLAAGAAFASKDLSGGQALPRVEHHLREAEQVARHFEKVMQSDCRRFATAAEWRSYFDGEIDQMILMVAHVEQAWVEAKRTGDDDVRRVAKAPRRRLEEARGLVGKLQDCAASHGASFPPTQVWRRVEREVPQRQAQIALPEPASASPVAAPGSQ